MTREQAALALSQKGQTYIVDGTLNHGGVTYPHGTQLSGDQFTDEEFLALRDVRTLLLPAEALPPEVVAQDMEALKSRNADLEAQLAALLAQQGKGKKPSSSDEA